MNLWCFDDAHHWGQLLRAAAVRRGHEVSMFDEPRVPDSGYVFMHMSHHQQVRMFHKRAMAIMAMNPNLTLIPSYRASDLYDDKLEQARQLSRWMPRTHVFYTPGSARRYLSLVKFPFVSKSSEGSSGHNVRVIRTMEEAREEIRLAFSDIGVRGKHGMIQRGYLLWQDHVEGPVHDLRVVAVGRQRMILQRRFREGDPTSGRSVPVTRNAIDNDMRAGLELADEFLRTEDIRWCAVDLVSDGANWYVIECSAGWTMNSFYECDFVGPAGETRKGIDVWEVLLDEIEAGVFA